MAWLERLERPVRFVALISFLAGPTAAQTSRRTEDEHNTIEVFSKAKRGVVHIRARQQQSTEFGTAQSSESTGTGFLIDEGGHVLTNYHVIDSANRIEVHLPGGSMSVARVVGTAPALDLALLRVDSNGVEAAAPLPLGDSDAVVVGQKVITIGHPLALHNTLTVGVISAVHRSFPGGPPELEGAHLQTDAAINPGNSGGPLLDSEGRVIGIATARSHAWTVSLRGARKSTDAAQGRAQDQTPRLLRAGHRSGGAGAHSSRRGPTPGCPRAPRQFDR